jgi:hypothetical protein
MSFVAIGIQADQIPMAGRSQGLDPTMQEIRETQELQAKTRAMYGSAHLRNIHDRQIFRQTT